MRGSEGSMESWPQVIEVLINPEVPIMWGSIALDGVLDLKWSRNSLIFFQSTITRGPLRLAECSISSDQSTINQSVTKYSFYFYQTQIQCSGAAPKHVGPSMRAGGYRVTALSSHSYNPNCHICESIYYFANYLLLLIGSCLTCSYISDKFF